MCLDALGRPQLPQRQLHGARAAPAPVFVRHFRGESEAQVLALPLDSTATSLLVPAEPQAPLLSFVIDVMSSLERQLCRLYSRARKWPELSLHGVHEDELVSRLD